MRVDPTRSMSHAASRIDTNECDSFFETAAGLACSLGLCIYYNKVIQNADC
jgi:hypothetical protein